MNNVVENVQTVMTKVSTLKHDKCSKVFFGHLLMKNILQQVLLILHNHGLFPTFNDNISDKVAPEHLIAHSCATANKWKDNMNEVTNEEKFKEILVKVR